MCRLTYLSGSMIDTTTGPTDKHRDATGNGDVSADRLMEMQVQHPLAECDV
jgi:hypothetical protein